MDKLGITEEILLSVLEGESVDVRVNSDCLSVRLVLEVSDFVLSKSLPLCSVCCCICRLVGVPVESVNARRESPDFVVEYDDDMDEGDDEWRFQLFDDYKNGDLRLLTM